MLAICGSACAWTALTEADLVVTAPGRVRASEIPTQVFVPADTQLLGRVTAVHCRPGQTVRQGELLVRLDTRALRDREPQSAD